MLRTAGGLLPLPGSGWRCQAVAAEVEVNNHRRRPCYAVAFAAARFLRTALADSAPPPAGTSKITVRRVSVVRQSDSSHLRDERVWLRAKSCRWRKTSSKSHGLRIGDFYADDFALAQMLAISSIQTASESGHRTAVPCVNDQRLLAGSWHQRRAPFFPNADRRPHSR